MGEAWLPIPSRCVRLPRCRIADHALPHTPIARLRPGSHPAESTPSPPWAGEGISPDCRRPQPLTQQQGGIRLGARPHVQQRRWRGGSRGYPCSQRLRRTSRGCDPGGSTGGQHAGPDEAGQHSDLWRLTKQVPTVCQPRMRMPLYRTARRVPPAPRPPAQAELVLPARCPPAPAEQAPLVRSIAWPGPGSALPPPSWVSAPL